MQDITIFAESFRNGETIPAEYTCEGENVSPSISWSGIPEGTKSIALIMDDPDAPRGTFIHWVLYNIPANINKLPRSIQGAEILKDGSRHGTTDFGRVGYGGPCPPYGVHRYYFRIYAIDIILSLGPGVHRTEVDKAMKGHILGKGELMGRYERHL